MYALVGCRNCSMLWIVEGRPKTTQCPRCGASRQYEKFRKFVETDDEDHARDVRASILANRQGEGEAFAELDSFAEMETTAEDGVVSDEEYLDESGLDPDAVETAAERATEGTGGSRSRSEIVRAAVREQDGPTEEEVVAFASEEGVSAEYVRKALQKLVRSGEASESRGEYRLL